MAKFKDLNLILQQGQRIYLGDDTASNPVTYPASSTAERAMMAYTTISGYNDTGRGGVVNSITPVDELVITMPLAGERATEDYHMVRYDQLAEFQAAAEGGDWQESVLTISGTPPGSPTNGDRYLVDSPATGDWSGLEDYIVQWDTASGTWDNTPPDEGMTTFVEDINKFYVYFDGSWTPMGEGIDHGDLGGLDDDDHTMYVPTDGSRGFTNTVSGIDPTTDYHLTTKFYVDDLINTLSGSIITDHGLLDGLADDDHTQYILVDGTRGFTGTVSGIDPTESYHLTTKFYVDGEINTLSGTIYNELDNYVTIATDQTITGNKTFDGTTTFNDVMTVNSGIEFGTSTISGTGTIYTGEIFAGNQKWGRESMIAGVRDQTVSFGTAWPADDYTVVTSITNEIDGTPSIYSATVGAKTGSGFIVHFSGKIDSDDFVLEWHAFYGQFN